MPDRPALRIAAAVAIVGVLAFGAVGAFWRPAWLSAAGITAALAHMRAIGWLGLLLCQVLVAVSGVLPASLIGIAAGALYGVGAGFALSASSVLVGAGLAFLLSRSLFRPAVERLLSRRPRLARVDRLIAGDAWRLVCLLRISPVMPFAATSYALGLSSVAFRDYLIGTLAALPALFGFVCAGALADQELGAWQQGSGALRLALLGVGLAATLALTWRTGRLARQAGLFGGIEAEPEFQQS